MLSLNRLNRLVEIDPVARTATVDAGVTLSQLNTAAAEHGLWFPVDLGADPQIGGMIATNTGGTRLVRYGDVRQNLLGVEAVLGDGRVVDRLKALRKDNTGFDLKQAFVGTSGSFGIVTRAVLSLAPLPRQRVAALACCANGEAALALLSRLDREAGDALTAFETLSREALVSIERHGANLRNPFPDGFPAYAVLIELSSTFSPERLDLEELLGDVLAEHMESDPDSGLEDVLLGQAEDFWNWRHQVSESLAEDGRVLAFDLGLPRSSMARFTDAVREKISARWPFVRVCDFGHWGDGGTHLNLVWDDTLHPVDKTLWREMQTCVYDTCVHDFAGSFSAEHGVGPHNAAFYERYASDVQRAASGALKHELDALDVLGRVRWD